MLEFADTLKTWRAARRLSQLDLASEAEVSARHISFLETGRARPSREMIAKLGQAMQLPLSVQNQMLTLAGFAARYPTRSLDSEQMLPIRSAIDVMLERHVPYPGMAMDRLWTVLRMNEAAKTLFGPFGLEVGGSLLEFMMSRDLPGVVENWPAVASHTATRLRTESLAQGGIPDFEPVIAYLSSFSLEVDVPVSPVVPTILRLGESRISLFATISQFGTPEDITLDDMKIELYFPMDEESREILRGLVQSDY